jgi:hypothetical protein
LPGGRKGDVDQEESLVIRLGYEDHAERAFSNVWMRFSNTPGSLKSECGALACLGDC